MTPLDIRLPIIAKQAKVRPPHVFHVWCAIRDMKANFHTGAFAEFTGLEPRHIEAIISALKANNAMPKPAKQEIARGTRIGIDFEVPLDWINWAIKERGWQASDAKQEALSFVDYWAGLSGSNGVKSDWLATWRNWCRRSKRAGAEKVIHGSDPREILQRELRAAEMLGHDYEAGIIRRKLDAMDNVLPFKAAG